MVSFRKNWRTAFRLVGGSETTSGSIDVAAQHEQLLDLLAGLAGAAVRRGLRTAPSGTSRTRRPACPMPVMPSIDEQSGGTFPASLAA